MQPIGASGCEDVLNHILENLRFAPVFMPPSPCPNKKPKRRLILIERSTLFQPLISSRWIGISRADNGILVTAASHAPLQIRFSPRVSVDVHFQIRPNYLALEFPIQHAVLTLMQTQPIGPELHGLDSRVKPSNLAADKLSLRITDSHAGRGPIWQVA